jgi:hypothetical protein
MNSSGNQISTTQHRASQQKKKTASSDYRNRAQPTFIYKHDGGDTRLKRRDEQAHVTASHAESAI